MNITLAECQEIKAQMSADERAVIARWTQGLQSHIRLSKPPTPKDNGASNAPPALRPSRAMQIRIGRDNSKRVLAWLEAGNTGDKYQIAAAMGQPEQANYYGNMLQRFVKRGDCTVVGRSQGFGSQQRLVYGARRQAAKKEQSACRA